MHPTSSRHRCRLRVAQERQTRSGTKRCWRWLGRSCIHNSQNGSSKSVAGCTRPTEPMESIKSEARGCSSRIRLALNSCLHSLGRVEHGLVPEEHLPMKVTMHGLVLQFGGAGAAAVASQSAAP